MATEIAAAYVELGARIGKLEAGLAAASAQIDGFAKKADVKAAGATAAFSQMGRGVKIATVAVAGGLALAVKSAADFDARLSQVKAVTGATAKQMDTLRRAALDTSKSTQGFGYTAKEVADAQVELGKAGLSVGQIIGGGMKSALVLARAGNLQLADAAAYTSNAMQQFGISGKDSAQVADALAQAANSTTADVGDFGAALVQTGAAARSAGLSFNDTMTVLTALAASGVKGSDAGTSLKTSLIQLVKPTNKQAEAAKAAGISFLDQNKNMRSLADISGQLRARTANMTQAQRTALFATLAGTDGVRTLLALYNSGPGKIAQYSAALGKSGTAQKQAATMNDNAAGKFKQLMASIQAAGIEIGTALLPPLAALASAIAAVVSKFTAFKPVAYAAAAAIGVVIAAMAINKVVGFAGAVMQAARAVGILGAASTAGAAAGGVGAAGAAAGGAAGKMGMLASALPLVANPLGLLAVTAGVGAAALLMFGKRTDANAEFLGFLGQGAANARAQIAQTNTALTGQASATQQVIANTRAATVARQGETQAVMNYLGALEKGKAANETDAQYQARLAGLYRTATQAKLTATQAQAQQTEAVRKAVDGVTKLADSSNKELDAARKRVEQAKQANQANALLGKSDEARAKAQAELQISTAALAVAESRRGERLKQVEKAQVATREAIKKSSMTDAEKAASLDVVNRAISKTRGEISKLPDTKTTTVKVKDNATTPVQNIKGLLGGIDRFITVTVKAVKEGTGWASGGFVPHFAGGGTVRGPGGKDRVPAMLTAGEVVLTKRQQAMVNRGMSIRDAIRRTGGAFAKGGFVAPKQGKDEKPDAYRKRVAKAKAAWLKGKRDPIREALGGIGEAVKGNVLGRFDRETQRSLADIEKNFTGTGIVAGKSFAQLDKDLAANLADIEKRFVGTGTVAGLSFKNIDKEMRKAQATLTAFYDQLTPAEAQIKSLQDAATQQDLASGVSDAQAKLQQAQDFGDPAAIAAARKAVDDAVRAQTIAGLQQTAADERALREQQRQEAQDAFDTEWETKRATLQEQLDGQLQQERDAAATRQAELQTQLDARLQSEQDARDQLRMQREIELEQLTTNLQGQATTYKGHFSEVLASVRAFAKRMRTSGANIGQAIADGLNESKGELKGAAAGLATILENFLRTHSPSKKGPLSTLNTWMDGFTPALMSGMDTAAMEAGIASAVAAPTVMRGAGVASSVNVNLTVNDSTFAGMSREQADRVARDIQAAIDRQVRASI